MGYFRKYNLYLVVFLLLDLGFLAVSRLLFPLEQFWSLLVWACCFFAVAYILLRMTAARQFDTQIQVFLKNCDCEQLLMQLNDNLKAANHRTRPVIRVYQMRCLLAQGKLEQALYCVPEREFRQMEQDRRFVLPDMLYHVYLAQYYWAEDNRKDFQEHYEAVQNICRVEKDNIRYGEIVIKCYRELKLLASILDLNTEKAEEFYREDYLNTVYDFDKVQAAFILGRISGITGWPERAEEYFMFAENFQDRLYLGIKAKQEREFLSVRS